MTSQQPQNKVKPTKQKKLSFNFETRSYKLCSTLLGREAEN